jgi:branched-chain amino acid transport system substrate-binding protein
MWNTFRTCGRDDQQGSFAAGYLLKNFKGKSIAIVNDKTTYGKGLADEVKKALNAAGVKEKLYESYNMGDKDFTALVSKLKLNGIDIVYDGGYHQEAGLIVRQMRDQGLQTILMAGDALADREFASITGPAGAGVLFTFGPDPRKRQSAAAIVKEFKDRGIDPEGYTLYTYAAFQVWAQAAAKAGSVEPEKVAAAMHEGTWDTVLGPLSFDKKGDITAIGWAVFRWDKDGDYDEITDLSKS